MRTDLLLLRTERADWAKFKSQDPVVDLIARDLSSKHS